MTSTDFLLQGQDSTSQASDKTEQKPKFTMHSRCMRLFFCARTVFARHPGTHKKHGSICHITTAEKNAGCKTKGEGCKKTKKIRSHCRCNCINILHQKRDEKGKKNPPLAFFCVFAGTGNGLPEQASHKINRKRACTYGSRKGGSESNLPKGRGTRVYLPNLREKIQN